MPGPIVQVQTMAADPTIIDVNENDFEARVLEGSRGTPVMVDFWAEWCPPCRALTPVLERVAAEYGGRVILAKIDVDENMKLAGRYQLRGFPTVILFINGAEVDRFSSARAPGFVREFLDRHLDSPAVSRSA
jgi:putative thioredoxin